jgi:hypothetical protein
MQDERSKIWFLLVLGILYCLALGYIFQKLPSKGYNDDFHARWYASRQQFENGRSIYDWENAEEVSKLTGWPRVYELRYYYPAYLQVFTAPLSFLPYPLARFLWTIFGLWALWAGTLLFLHFPRQVLSVNQITILLVLITTSLPVFQHTLNGQFNTIGVLSLGLTYWALYRKQYLLAGIFSAGTLFKPQATIFALGFLAFWSLWEKARWTFLLGLGLAALGLWGIAELLEPQWVPAFLESLGSYTEIRSVLMQLGDTRAFLSVGLGLLTLWLFWRWREQEPPDWTFRSVYLWAVSMSVLVIPLYAMLHAVLLGPMCALLLGIVADWKPAWLQRTWWLTIAIFIIGLSVFIAALLLTGTTGWHINAPELVYRVTAPIIIGGITLASLLSMREKHEQLI